MVAKNPFVKPGTLEIDGVTIDMSQVDLDSYVIGGITDHITPWKGCYGTARLFGEKSTFVLANAGHLQSLINPPGGSKSFYIAGPATEPDPTAWAERMQPERREGSWWPHWRSMDPGPARATRCRRRRSSARASSGRSRARPAST